MYGLLCSSEKGQNYAVTKFATTWVNLKDIMLISVNHKEGTDIELFFSHVGLNDAQEVTNKGSKTASWENKSAKLIWEGGMLGYGDGYTENGCTVGITCIRHHN